MSTNTISTPQQHSEQTLATVRPRQALRARIAARTLATWQRVEELLIRASDWLNPILVKETRQALKSFQFTITFVLVLAACWIVTIGVVAYIGPSVYYAASGGTLLLWYYAVLAFPLIVVVPYSAFRSLAAEREDNTYDLLSITTLKPRQIISGKLGSAIVQMAVYFSAITPCLAFTYLLRGVDVPTILLLLAYTFFGSLGLSMIGILLATLVVQRFAQVFLSVAFVAGLFGMLYLVIWIGFGTIYYSYSFIGGNAFWITALALTTAYGTFFALAYFAAASMITFTSENRSTPLRICMMLQQAAFVGWMAFAWIYADFEHFILLLMAAVAGIYWFVMGALLTSERPGMSQRARRRLPRSFLARLFFTWFNPGPATGYMFVVANATTIAVLCLLGIAGRAWLGKGTNNWPNSEELLYSLVVGWGYLVAYLGLGMVVVRGLRRLTLVTMLASVLIHFLVVLAGTGIPMVIQFMSVRMREAGYTLWQLSNPFWSLIHLVDGGLPTEGYFLILIIPAAAICMLLVNLGAVLRELQVVRVAPPPRVLQDEAELKPPAVPTPTNPWDEP